MMKKHIHIPLKGIEGHITWTGDDPPSEEMMQALNDMAEKALEMFQTTPERLKQRRCEHEWVETHSGYCADCSKCGLKI